MNRRPTAPRRPSATVSRRTRRAAADRVNAFVDRLLYGDWLQDERLDRMKLALIGTIAEWARHAPRAG